jgi:LmbE family N-acetylglucosaminyl deacetylase
MSILSRIIHIAVPIPKVENFDRYLFIGPHPDDIEIGAGATAAKLAALGKKVTFLVCLDGRYGLENAPEGITSEELIEIRKKESIASAQMLGVSDVRFLGLSDGGFYRTGLEGGEHPDEGSLLAKMARVIGEVQPDIIFATDPDVKSECHTDHINVGECAKRLAFFAPFKDIMAKFGAGNAQVKAIAFYMTGRPNRYVGTGKRLIDKQLASVFECHQSQYPAGCPDIDSLKLYIKLRAFFFGLRSFKGQAEGFRVLGRTHMHCLPEAEK